MAAAVTLLAASACNAPAMPSSGDAANTASLSRYARPPRRPADTTSILKLLTTDVAIGSTVDTGNGDKGPRGLSIANGSPHGKLTKGQLVVCNFEDATGKAGAGTTIEALNPAPSSSPSRFIQDSRIKGCDGAGIHPKDGTVYAAGLTSGMIAVISKKGGVQKVYRGKALDDPFWDIVADPQQTFSPLYVYVGTTSGGIVSISVGFYGNGRAIEVAKGFAVSQGSQGELAPSGLQYDPAIDTLYIVDGKSNTVVAFSNASYLLDKDEIVVQPGGTTFKCKHPKTTCGSLVYSGSPLDAPMASALLPNGNLIVANTQGTANMLVELTPQGQVLDTKVVDQSATQGVFGLVAAGKSDATTVLFYADTNSNAIHELEQ
ncbi:MAG TPA: hypothetical protein VMU38_08555 [Candidatus Binatia bacterium]|nr:hypothetical protein [Candidatus Binatia bacterium]